MRHADAAPTRDKLGHLPPPVEEHIAKMSTPTSTATRVGEFRAYRAEPVPYESHGAARDRGHDIAIGAALDALEAGDPLSAIAWSQLALILSHKFRKTV